VSGPAYVSDPTVLYLHQLLDELAKGYLQIPQFQRRFVWTDEQRLELLQSIRDGISIGSILVWRTNLTTLKVVPNIGPHQLPAPAPSPATARSYLLDGLQRLSTLYGCLRPLPANASAFTRDEDGNDVSWLVGYDLETERFAILEREETPTPTWLPLSLLLDSIRLLQFQRGLAGQPDADQLIQRADALAETFRSYKLPVIPVVTDDLTSATRTFERINRPGTPMSELHMVRALTWRPDFDLEERLSEVCDELAEAGWSSLEPELILEVCKAALGVDINVKAPDELSKRLAVNPSVLDDITQGLLRTTEWLGKHCEVLSPEFVPYRMQTVLLAEVMRRYPVLDPVISERLQQWFWYTAYTGYNMGLFDDETSALREMLRGIEAGSPLHPKEKVPRPPFTNPRHDARNTKLGLVFALRLAAMKPLDLDGAEIDAAKQLVSKGRRALVPIVPRSKRLSSCIFTKPKSELRSRLRERAPDINQEILNSHAITQEAAKSLVARDYESFVLQRTLEIDRREDAFWDSLFDGDLAPASEPSIE
jgi:hypothetical protein